MITYPEEIDGGKFEVLGKRVTIIRNMTPHVISIVNRDGFIIDEFPPDPQGPIRVSTKYSRVGPYISMPMEKEISNLPEEIPGVALIVSYPAKIALFNRKDILTVSMPVKNSDGQIIGCMGLIWEWGEAWE